MTSVLGDSRGLRVTAIGIGVGSLLAVAASRLLASQAPDLMNSPWMLIAVAGTALAVDPLTALRSE